MFKGLGAMMSLLGNQGKLQEEVQKFQAHVGTITADATAGAGMVTVKANGRLEVVSVTIAADAMTDREMLEDLVAAAVNQALNKAREQVAAASAKMAENMGLPPGMLGGGLPGLG